MRHVLLRVMMNAISFQRCAAFPARQITSALPAASRLFAAPGLDATPVLQRAALWRSTNMSTRAAGATQNDEGGTDDSDEIDGDGFEDEFEDLEDDVGPEVNTCGTAWGEAALTIAKELLPAGGDLQLFSLRALQTQNRLDVRLDKLSDEFGSPSLEEVEQFSRALSAGLEAALGEAADNVEIEVSSPGAERAVRVPMELERFADLPMKVEFMNSDGSGAAQTCIFDLFEVDEAAGTTKWRLADVKANRESKGKGRRLNKKEKETVWEINVSDIQRVNLHVDV